MISFLVGLIIGAFLAVFFLALAIAAGDDENAHR